MQRFCESLREHAMKISNFKKKKMTLLINEHQTPYENAKLCYIFVKKKSKINMLKIKNNCNLKHSVPKEIPQWI